MQDESLTSVSDFATRLRALIDAHCGGVHAELARKTGITTAAIANYANEEKPRLPQAIQLHAIARALGVSMEYLLTGKSSSESTERPAVVAERGMSFGSLSKIDQLAAELESKAAQLRLVVQSEQLKQQRPRVRVGGTERSRQAG